MVVQPVAPVVLVVDAVEVPGGPGQWRSRVDPIGHGTAGRRREATDVPAEQEVPAVVEALARASRRRWTSGGGGGLAALDKDGDGKISQQG